ncbi:MAG: N-succinylarginine dihydrolase [Planctomycetaceae bacterium]|nr:N-succinylarginine dihydrolase [Planctomycetaceae bacterium]
MTDPATEINFDSIVGPTHHYGGLGAGNLASQRHGGNISHPKRAALEGLAKMKLVADLGVHQAVLPPHPRPDVDALRRLGFHGDDANVLATAHRHAPNLLAAAASASAMWAANSATVSPSPDTTDRRVHITPANLTSQLHRALETQTTAKILRAIFHDQNTFIHHAPLPATRQFGDEGAANHTRLCAAHGSPGIELFACGSDDDSPHAPAPQRFTPRQTHAASQAVARLHALRSTATLTARVHPNAIDAGVFHLDVIAVGNLNVFLYRERAFADTSSTIDQLRRTFAACCDDDLIPIEITSGQLTLDEAVSTYLFNSQLLSLPSGRMAMVVADDCEQHPRARAALEHIVASHNPIDDVHFVNVRQSMRNGGGPACLRLRVVLTESQRAAMHPGILFTNGLYEQLLTWVNKHYRDQLGPDDLADPRLLVECRAALDELTQLLQLGSIYRFQLA